MGKNHPQKQQKFQQQQHSCYQNHFTLHVTSLECYGHNTVPVGSKIQAMEGLKSVENHLYTNGMTMLASTLLILATSNRFQNTKMA